MEWVLALAVLASSREPAAILVKPTWPHVLQSQKPKKLEMIAGAVLSLATSPLAVQQRTTGLHYAGDHGMVDMGDSRLHEEEQGVSRKLSDLEEYAGLRLLLP